MMDLDPVEARLKAAGVRRVSTVGQLADISKLGERFYPATYLVPDFERGGAKAQITGVHDQAVECGFLAVTVVGGEAANPDALAAELKREVDLIEDALIAWPHPDADGSGTEFASGRALSIGGRAFVWGSAFRTLRIIRKLTRET